MAQVTRTITLNATAADVWAAIGDFQGLATWHPGIQGSTKEMVDGAEHRRLDLGGGAEVVEKLMGSDGMSYGYEIVSAPLPLANYSCVMSVMDLDGKALVHWCANFDVTGDGAEAAIIGVYEGGFASLAEKFGT